MTGYASRRDSDDRVCLDCCAREEIAWMRSQGKTTLYLSGPAENNRRSAPGTLRTGDGWKVINWPGTLEFKPTYVKSGSHNIAGRRLDVWINGPDGFVWHGVCYGYDSELCHLRRTKEAWTTRMSVPAVAINWPIKADPDTRNAADVPIETRDLTDGERAFLTLGTTSTPDRASVTL